MASMFVVVANILIEDLSQPLLVQHNQTIQAFSTDRADHAFDICILPGGTISSADLFDTHELHYSSEL